MAARQLRNISGETRTLQDSQGRWHIVPPDGVYTVEPGDDRYYQTGDAGEPVIWEDAGGKTTSTKTTTKKENG